jgi:exosortase A-associated hydrolase 1
MRRVIRFASGSHDLVGTLDEANGCTGVLIVSGGSEPRMGAHRGMAMLAARLAADGVPVFRFDRRGVGDSEGEDAGFEASLPDIGAACGAFRGQISSLRHVIGFGNCDAASALALGGRACGFEAVLLANPWLREETDALPPAAAIRARYAQRLRDPAEWRRLLTGGVDLGKLAGGLAKLGRGRGASDPLADRVLAGIDAWGDAARIVLAESDATAIAFAEAAEGRNYAIERVATASHSFVGHADTLHRLLIEAIPRLP